MKATLYSQTGEKKSQVELPKIFSTRVREDIVQKYFEAKKSMNPYSPDPRAGLHQSASGTISHKRHDWKGHYGRGVSRAPRKTMWRRGTQFYWIGADAPGTRGGRKAHPPRGYIDNKKINKKESLIALNSAFAATAHPDYLIKRYASISSIKEAPIIIESLPQKTKLLQKVIEKILGEQSALAWRKKTVRPGKGKLRGRKYKSNAGILIVTSSKELHNFKGVDTKTVKEITVADMYPLGRLTMYTKNALEEMSKEKKQ